MDAIREQFENPVVVGIVGFVVGVFIGLVVLGWWLFPVQWTDASPADLRPDAQVDYLRMAIDSYTLNKDADLAMQRWNELGDQGPEILGQIQGNPGNQSMEFINGYANVVQSQPAETPTEEEGSNLTLLLVMCLVTVLLAGGLAAYLPTPAGSLVGSGITSSSSTGSYKSNRTHRLCGFRPRNTDVSVYDHLYAG